jgi:hypothetical protein
MELKEASGDRSTIKLFTGTATCPGLRHEIGL